MSAPIRIRTLSITLALGVVAGAGLVIYWFGGLSMGPAIAGAIQSRKAVRFSVQMLDREQLLFLVTDRVATQVVVEHDQRSVLLGERRGYLVATVRLLYGIDLQQITDANVEQTDDEVRITVPRPTLLTFAADPNMRFISKRSGLVAIADWFGDHNLENELRAQIRDEAIRFVNEQNLAPDPQAVLTRLNRFASVLGVKDGLHVQFQYRTDEAQEKTADR